MWNDVAQLCNRIGCAYVEHFRIPRALGSLLCVIQVALLCVCLCSSVGVYGTTELILPLLSPLLLQVIVSGSCVS